jgi:predicted regulator of amino acid metabolism with ACT domain
MAMDEETVRRRYREFLELMPLTISIAGLPVSQSPFNFSADQMEVRTTTLATAFKLARQLVRDSVTNG